MNFYQLVATFALGPVLSSARNVVTETEGNQIANAINELRQGKPDNSKLPPSINSRYVRYNRSVQVKMDSWFNENGLGCWIPGNVCRSMLHDPEFRSEYNEGWHWAFFDSTNNRPNPVLGIINFRTKFQRPCFDYTSCDPNPDNWSNYYSCLSTSLPKKVHCRNFLNYLPPLLNPDLAQIACKLTGMKGPFNQKGQPNSFYCITKLLDKHGKPAEYTYDEISDQPYTAALGNKKPCSDCPDDAKECYKDLCIDKMPPTKAPTFFPTFRPTNKPSTQKPTSKAPTQKPTTRAPTLRI